MRDDRRRKLVAQRSIHRRVLAAESPHPADARPDQAPLVTKTRQKKPPPRSSSRSASPWVSLARTGANLNVEDFLTFRITRLSNALRTNLTKRYLEEFDLSLPEWRLLALIARFAPMRFSEVTTRSSMDKGQVSRTLRVMEKRGLTKLKVIRGSRAAEALAAPVMVSITPKGKTLYKAVLPVARRRQAEMLLTLSEGDRVALYATLDKLLTRIGGVGSTDASE
ncbi:MAG: MarR family transcriptional regulator [Lysobacterales bacterium]|nr:MAG: MarR family transcriptional regulator [Xanthomonadales bacterium]